MIIKFNMSSAIKSMVMCLSIFVMDNAWATDPVNDDFPYTKNVGRIQGVSSEMATAVMLNTRLVVAPAHAACVYNPSEDQIFIQSCDYDAPVRIDQIAGSSVVLLSDTIRELEKRKIPYSRYEVIYAPKKIPHNLKMPEIDLRDRDALTKQIQLLFDEQENVAEIFKEDKGIDGFTYPGGDWVILKLRTAIPVATLPIEQFKAKDLSGMESVCLGATCNPIMLQDKAVFKVTPKTLMMRPIYREERDVFYTVVRSIGAQDAAGLIKDSQGPQPDCYSRYEWWAGVLPQEWQMGFRSSCV